MVARSGWGILPEAASHSAEYLRKVHGCGHGCRLEADILLGVGVGLREPNGERSDLGHLSTCHVRASTAVLSFRLPSVNV